MNTIIDITMLEELIVNESLNRGNSEEEYRTLFDNFGYEYLNQINRSVRPYIDAEARLAVCIAIVGSRNIDEFGIAMILLLQLAAIGGAYWVAQEELFRHYSVKIMNLMHTTGSDEQLLLSLAIGPESAFEKVLSQSIASDNKILVEKLSLLEKEFRTYCQTRSQQERRAIITRSQLSYPIESFCAWFVTWARNIIIDLKQAESPHLHFPKQFSEVSSDHGVGCGGSCDSDALVHVHFSDCYGSLEKTSRHDAIQTSLKEHQHQRAASSHTTATATVTAMSSSSSSQETFPQSIIVEEGSSTRGNDDQSLLSPLTPGVTHQGLGGLFGKLFHFMAKADEADFV